MTYKTILAVLACPADVDATINAALKLPAGRDVHIIGCHGEPSQFVIMSAPVDVPDVATVTMLYEEADQRMTALGEAFSAACLREGVPFEWRPMRTPGGDSATSALTSARTADLVIVRQPNDEAEDVPATDFKALLFEGGRPVLMLGADGVFADPPKRVVIAWDGSREASRAVEDAMPFLKTAQSVHILIIDPDKLPDIDRPTPGQDLATNLDRHGVKTTIDVIGSGVRTVSQVIEAHVAATNADLLVMGAYTHLRLREWLFGGVTRTVMDKVPVATLLSR